MKTNDSIIVVSADMLLKFIYPVKFYIRCNRVNELIKNDIIGSRFQV